MATQKSGRRNVSCLLQNKCCMFSTFQNPEGLTFHQSPLCVSLWPIPTQQDVAFQTYFQPDGWCHAIQANIWPSSWNFDFANKARRHICWNIRMACHQTFLSDASLHTAPASHQASSRISDIPNLHTRNAISPPLLIRDQKSGSNNTGRSCSAGWTLQGEYFLKTMTKVFLILIVGVIVKM